jgi:hypothetical protein
MTKWLHSNIRQIACVAQFEAVIMFEHMRITDETAKRHCVHDWPFMCVRNRECKDDVKSGIHGGNLRRYERVVEQDIDI